MREIDISELSVTERLQVMEALWDSLTHDSEEIASPDWHKAVLEERRRKIDSGEAEFLSIKELKARRRR